MSSLLFRRHVAKVRAEQRWISSKKKAETWARDGYASRLSCTTQLHGKFIQRGNTTSTIGI
tara:strand:+ start:10816 stop:10998 length:183 start_codon:yes stop_codon:yes gene_type:complete